MREIILNNFGVIGMILFALNIWMIKLHIGEEDSNKWAVFGLWIIFVFSLIGLVLVFDFIGKWLLK